MIANGTKARKARRPPATMIDTPDAPRNNGHAARAALETIAEAPRVRDLGGDGAMTWLETKVKPRLTATNEPGAATHFPETKNCTPRRGRSKRGAATSVTEARKTPLLHALNGSGTGAALGRPETTLSAPLTVPELCKRLKATMRYRQSATKAQRRITRSAVCFIKGSLGYSSQDETADHGAVETVAEKVFKAFEQSAAAALKVGMPPSLPEAEHADEAIYRAAAPFVFAAIESRRPFDRVRDYAEADLQTLAKQLPVCEWWCAHRGCTPLSLGQFAGIIGDFNDYRGGYSAIKKRIGLAPRVCYSMVTKSGKTANAFPGQTYSTFFAWACSQIQIRGHYRPAYDAEKARLQAMPEKQKNIHRRAIRIMLDTALRELYEQWTGRSSRARWGNKKAHAPARSSDSASGSKGIDGNDTTGAPEA